MDWVWRRLVPLICLALALVVLLRLGDKVDKTQVQVESQSAARQTAREVLCGGLYGVQEAGRLILLGELPPPAPKMPPISITERRQRELFAQSYARVISRRVLEQAGVEAKDILRRDGTVDCDALNQIAVASPSPAP